ncbi:MAG: enoyl-CoA hydratase/isomerase family protein [Candidatus Hermodarchaeota archaeon]
MTEFDTIVLEEIEQYIIIHLYRPDSLNSLNMQLAEDLHSCLQYISEHHKIRTILITGKGKAFCAGGDINDFKKAVNPSLYMKELAQKFHAALNLLKTCNLPTLAVINGACFGAGLGLASACDLRVCSNNAKFGSAFTGLGLSPDSSLTYHLPKIVGLTISKDLILTNRILTAEEALNFNLVSRVYETVDSLITESKKIAVKLSKIAPIASVKARNLIETSFCNDYDSQINLEIKNIIECAGSDDFQEGIKAFLEKRNPNFKGA